MELIALCGVLLSLLSVSLLQYYLSTLKAKSRLPPGKTGWPVIGESIEFVFCLQNVNLEKFSFKRMLKYCPEAFRTSVFGDHVAVLCGSAGNKFLFSKDKKLVKTWVIRPLRWIFRVDELEAPFGQYIKPEFVKFVKLDGLRNFIGVMDAMARHHLETHWEGRQVTTVYPSVKRYAFALACRILMSIEDPHVVEPMYDHLETLASGLNSIPINLPGTRLNRSIKAGRILRSQILQIVKRQKASSVGQSSSSDRINNFISNLQHVCDDKDVVNGILVLLLGGIDNVASVVCIALKVMADQPDIYRRVYQENMEIGMLGELLSLEDTQKMKYTWNVAREVMRLYPPTGFLTREALTDFTYAGYEIPKGHKLIANIHATHKDPKYFPDPKKFDPSRFDGDGPLPYTYVPFGGGSHLCPGMNYAQQVILVFIHNVVKRFKWEAKIGDEKVTGIPFPRLSQGLPIILHPHAD